MEHRTTGFTINSFNSNFPSRFLSDLNQTEIVLFDYGYKGCLIIAFYSTIGVHGVFHEDFGMKQVK